jgi:hypothetical protein
MLLAALTLNLFHLNHFSSSQFKIWERDRRLRFTLLLDDLAAHLPGAGQTGDTKWTKAQIVEEAIKFVKSNNSNSNKYVFLINTLYYI